MICPFRTARTKTYDKALDIERVVEEYPTCYHELCPYYEVQDMTCFKTEQKE